MKLSELDAVLRATWLRREMKPFCVTCGKPVERISEPMMHQDYKITVVFACHGRREEFRFDPESREPLANWPRRVFLRNWARYATTTKPPRRQVV